MNDFSGLLDVEKLGSAALTVGVLAPGFIIIYVRSLFLTGSRTSIYSALVEYVILSVVYFSFSLPIFISVGYFNWLAVEILVFFGPAFVGFILGACVQWGIGSAPLRWMKLNIVTPYPTGWDRAFGALKSEMWLAVTTKHHGVIFGRFGASSNASSLHGTRDIFIEEMRGENFEHLGDDSDLRGVWISEGQIDMIEIAYGTGVKND